MTVVLIASNPCHVSFPWASEIVNELGSKKGEVFPLATQTMSTFKDTQTMQTLKRARINVCLPASTYLFIYLCICVCVCICLSVSFWDRVSLLLWLSENLLSYHAGLNSQIHLLLPLKSAEIKGVWHHTQSLSIYFIQDSSMQWGNDILIPIRPSPKIVGHSGEGKSM